MLRHMTIATENLELVPWSGEALVALIEEPARFAELAGHEAGTGLREFFTSGEVSQAWIDQLRAIRGTDPWSIGFMVVDPPSRRVIGSAAFKGAPDDAGVVEVAYGIIPECEGRGYATESCRALVDYALATNDVKRVIAHTLPLPNASTRVLTRCGFRKTGEVVDPDDGLVWRWELERA